MRLRGWTCRLVTAVAIAVGCPREREQQEVTTDEASIPRMPAIPPTPPRARPTTAARDPRPPAAMAPPLELIRGESVTLPEGFEAAFTVTRTEFRKRVGGGMDKVCDAHAPPRCIYLHLETPPLFVDDDVPLRWLTFAAAGKLLDVLRERWGAPETSEGRPHNTFIQRSTGTAYHWYNPDTHLAAHLVPGYIPGSPPELIFNPYVEDDEVPAALLAAARPVLGAVMDLSLPGSPRGINIELPSTRGGFWPTIVNSVELPVGDVLTVRSLSTRWRPVAMSQPPAVFERAFGRATATCRNSAAGRVPALLFAAETPIVLLESNESWSITLLLPPASQWIDRRCEPGP